MQAPGQLNLKMWQGASWSYTLTWTLSSAPVNLAGYSARLQARESVNSSSPVLSLTSSDGITLGGAAGTITLSRSAAQTAALPPGRYVYDLELEAANGVVTRLVEGLLSIDPEVTR